VIEAGFIDGLEFEDNGFLRGGVNGVEVDVAPDNGVADALLVGDVILGEVIRDNGHLLEQGHEEGDLFDEGGVVIDISLVVRLNGRSEHAYVYDVFNECLPWFND
jgi:hypothetical protein